MISIVTPTYNRAHLIPRMIQSVLDQTYTDWELVIMDDGSTDDTEKVVNRIKDKRIRYYFTEKSGAGDKRNKGVDRAVNDYIIFLDSDDEVKADWLEKMAQPLRNYENVVVTCGWEKCDPSGKIIEAGLPQNLGNMFNNVSLNFLSGCMLYPKNSFFRAGGYDTELQSGQHTELLIRLLSVWKKEDYEIEKIDNPLVRIHIHQGERIRHNYKGLYLGTKRILEKHPGLFSKNPEARYNYLSVAAVNALRIGMVSEGRKYLYQSIKLNPLRLKNVIRLILSNIPIIRKVVWRKNL